MENIHQLLLKKLREELTPEEQALLSEWAAKDAANAKLLANLEDETQVTTWLKTVEQIDEEAAWQKLQQRSSKTVPVISIAPVQAVPPKQKRTAFWKIAAAVVLLLVTGTCIYLFKSATPSAQQNTIVKSQPPADVLPGGDKAILTLADGTRITLDSATNGSLASQGNIKVIKLDGGQLAYKGNPVDASGQLLYNTIHTPKGGQYQLVLADGTKVWLNASSSLRFPVAFIGTSRKVELTGEGYFEVAKKPSLPFVAEVSGTQVTVLGTHFNVMAYPNEKTQEVTLLEGSVRVSKGPHTVVIKPGEQASVGAGIQVSDVETDEVVAWKNGDFIFKNTDINEIGRQLERWYDITVETGYTTDLPRFYGVISRSATLSQVLHMLAATGTVQYSLEGKTLTFR